MNWFLDYNLNSVLPIILQCIIAAKILSSINYKRIILLMGREENIDVFIEYIKMKAAICEEALKNRVLLRIYIVINVVPDTN